MGSEGYFLLIATAAATIVSFWFMCSKSPTTTPSKSKSKSNSSTTRSTPASDLVGEYEVFLSFCGDDTRLDFTDFLNTYLTDVGIRTFRDSEGLHVGEEIGPDLLKTINRSKISIPIFSENYASRKWCLRELAEMVECEKKGTQKIFPIFYKVDPSEIQHQSGGYGKALCQHKKNNVNEETIEKWKKALQIVGGLKGLELKKETNGYQGQLVKKVAEDVLLELKKNYTRQPDNLVGIDHHIEAMEALLNVGSGGAKVVGIHGLGGLGKTTIAKVIYNRLCKGKGFEGCCFLEDVRENSKRGNGLLDLQKQLLSKIQTLGVASIYSVQEGIERIKDAVGVRKVLIVLDDVDDKDQVDMLVGNCSWFRAGSNIIITTRNKEVLDKLEATYQRENLHDVYGSYKPELMNPSHSLRLFSKCAFMMDSPPKEYDGLAEEFVSAAGGLPLVLVTIGSSLLGKKDIPLWKDRLRMLKETPHGQVLKKLKISFDALEQGGHKQIFLDIACFFIGEDCINPRYMWDACGFYPIDGLDALVLRHMVQIDDQLRDLGRQIVRDERQRSRLWIQKDTLDLWEGRVAAEGVEALVVKIPKDRRQSLVGEDFGHLRNLRFLRVTEGGLDGDLTLHLSNLRWLQWRSRANVLPTTCHLKNLVILDLSQSRVTDNWKGWSEIEMAKGLKVLTLTHCFGLRRSPVLFRFTTLERLNLSMCWNLEEIGPSIQDLTNLRVLDLSHCSKLRSLNCSTFSGLENLNLNGCTSLVRLDGLEQLQSLRYLVMEDCKSLDTILDLSNCTKLEKIDLSSCEKIIEVRGLDRLGSTEILDLSNCESIERLIGLSNLRKLKELILHRCYNLRELEGLGCLESLEHLDMFCCKSIERLPDLSNLAKLKSLCLECCFKLLEVKGLSALESLESLEFSNCDSVEELPDLSNLKNLKELKIPVWDNLTEIRGLEELRSLESLDISMCRLIDKLPDLSALQNLREINVSSCDKLTEIRGLEELRSLELLNIRGCKLIDKLPDLSALQNLREINVSDCDKLTEIRGLGELKSLNKLIITRCKSLGNLPSLPNTKIRD